MQCVKQKAYEYLVDDYDTVLQLQFGVGKFLAITLIEL